MSKKCDCCRRVCCCKKHCKCKREKKCCCREVRNTGCGGFNACTTIPTLLILCQSGLLNNDRAYILFLLFYMCGGANATGFNNSCC